MIAIVSANEAAHHLGLSEETVRRWIASGRLKADESGRADRATLSEAAALLGPATAHTRGLSADAVPTADIDSAPSTAAPRSAMSGIPEPVALVDRLQAKARRHAATAAMWQERAGTLAERLAAAESRLLAPAAPQRPPEAPRTPIVLDPTTEPPPSPLPWPIPPHPNVQALAPWPLGLPAIGLVVVLQAVPR